jgi:hypothetical protein
MPNAVDQRFSLHGKEAAVGSSPTEGFKGPANQRVLLPV